MAVTDRDRTTTRWRVPPTTHLDWRSWDDEYVVFHRQSGNTHLLNVVSAEALKSLQAQAARADELTRRVADRLGVEADSLLQSQLEQLLVQLDELGLIEPVDADE